MEIIKPHELQYSLVPAEPTGPRVLLNGANSTRIERISPQSFAYGTTEVDADFAKAWFEANKDEPFVKKGLVFMVASEAALRGEIKDRADELTGLEPLKQDGDKRLAGVRANREAGALAAMK